MAALPVRRMSWGAVLAGMVIAVVVQLILGLAGAAIGLSTLDPLRYNATPDAATFGAGAAIWWTVSSIVALFVGGWVAGHLAHSTERTDGMLHGLLAWGLATLLTVYLISSIAGSVVRGGATLVGGAASVVGGVATAAAGGAAAAAGPAVDAVQRKMQESGISVDDLKAQARKLLAQTGVPALQPDAMAGQASAAASTMTRAAATAGADGNAAGADLSDALQKIIASGKNTVDQVDRDALVNVVMAQAEISRAEAEQRVDGWIQTYQKARATYEQKKAEAEQKAREAADAAAKAASQAAFAATVALILGGIAAAVGGLLAHRRRLVVVDRMA